MRRLCMTPRVGRSRRRNPFVTIPVRNAKLRSPPRQSRKSIVQLGKSLPLKALITQLDKHTKNVENGTYIGKIGTQTRVIVGPKGIGKTTACTAFLRTVPYLYPKVVPVYVNCDYADQYHGTLATGVIEQLADYLGEPIEPNGDYYPSDIYQALEHTNQRMMLVIDEAEKLWEVDREQNEKSLYSMCTFASDPSGRLSTILCGSSSSLPYLINGSARKDKKLCVQYALAKKIPSLNHTKFRTYHLPLQDDFNLKYIYC
jgi:Cdc6-like AAA superfamily ATPase